MLALRRASVLRPLVKAYLNRTGSLESGIRDAVRELGVSKTTVWRWIRRLAEEGGRTSALVPRKRGRPTGSVMVPGGAIEGTAEEIIWRLKRTTKLALLRVKTTNRIVGVAALKTPDQGYRADKFAAAGVPIVGYEAAPELGYVVVAEDMRGRRLSGGLVDTIAKEIRKPAFATTDSNTMRNNLQRAEFIKVGQEWPGQKGALSLWTITPR